MSSIEQTNRTILFQEINPEKHNLLEIIGDMQEAESLSDEKIKELNEMFLVHSFDEFLLRFDPTIYYFFDANNQKVIYTLKKPEGISRDKISEVHINKENDFLRMLMQLIETKKEEKKTNVDFQFEKITQMLSPRNKIEEIRRERSRVQYLYTKFISLSDSNLEKQEIKLKIKQTLKRILKDLNDMMALILLAMEAILAKIFPYQKQEIYNYLMSVEDFPLEERWELHILEGPKLEEQYRFYFTEEMQKGFEEFVSAECRAEGYIDNEEISSWAIKVLCFIPQFHYKQLDIDLYVKQYNKYLEFYRNIELDFIKVVKPLAEKILGIWLFFDQYPVSLSGMKPSLFITNIKNEILLKINNISRFCAYLDTINGKNDFKNTIWYAIIPSVAYEFSFDQGLTRERFKGNTEIQKFEINAIENVEKLIKILKDYKIQCFFSFSCSEKTTFSSFATEGIQSWEEHCKPLIGKEYSEFAIPCFPNFTLIPKEYSGVILGKRLVLKNNQQIVWSEKKEDIRKIWIEGIYIEAAYVAAGLVAAYQCPQFLKSVFLNKVDDFLPGVRFDIEEKSHFPYVYTTMAKEITGWKKEIKEEIERKKFGFLFSSENVVVNGKVLTHIFVFHARSLLTDGITFEPIFKTQTTTYIEYVLRHATADFKKDNILYFFSNNPNSQKNQWLERRECINAILGRGEEIHYFLDEQGKRCEVEIVFRDQKKVIELVLERPLEK